MPTNHKKISFGRRVESFKYAWEGLLHLVQEEPNARIHLVAAIAAVLCGWYFGIDKSEWLVIVLCIGIVLITEAINTAIENVCDYISPAYHDKIKIIKDLSAAAVLISAVISIIIAGCIFVPKILFL